jgi:hypothetical protein
MHRCWYVPELLDMILGHLVGSESGEMTLSRLAVTCQRFQNPALNLLWREQQSLLPLLKCLPDVWLDLSDPESLIFVRGTAKLSA